MAEERTRTDLIIVHCTDTPAGREVSIEDVRQWHVEGNGWSDIGYHFYIDQEGDTFRGRDIALIGAHTYGHNRTSIGICLEGDGEYTDIQMESLDILVGGLWFIYPDVKEVRGHNYFTDQKECPCFDVNTWAWDRGFNDSKD